MHSNSLGCKRGNLRTCFGQKYNVQACSIREGMEGLIGVGTALALNQFNVHLRAGALSNCAALTL